MSRTIKQPSHVISGVFVFLLLGLFAVFSTVMVLTGAKAYKGTADRAAEHNAQRIAGAYVRSMVRSDDQNGGVRVEDVDGVPAITMENVYDGETYVTRVYAYDGMLREWFASTEVDFEPENGEMVCAADEMTAGIENGVLSVRVRNGENWNQVDIALRTAL